MQLEELPLATRRASIGSSKAKGWTPAGRQRENGQPYGVCHLGRGLGRLTHVEGMA